MKLTADAGQQHFRAIRGQLFHFAVSEFVDSGNRYVFVAHDY
jgi:hypothetical protein